MEARVSRLTILWALVVVSMGATYRTPNFIVETADPTFARQMGQTAEKCRRELAISWLGKAMPNWSQPCMMTVRADPRFGAGGTTKFTFDQGEVFDWRMTILGSRERLLDSVLPHEITHMIFASHFRQPVPRWADEGGASSVEHPSEQAKHRKMNVQFLKTRRGIAFNKMFSMAEYPPDLMPLYAQGHSLAEYLIQQKGRRKYIDFLDEGIKTKRWSEAVADHYHSENLGTLQTSWLAWVSRGCPKITPRPNRPETIARPNQLAKGRRPRPKPNLIYHIPNTNRVTSPRSAQPRPVVPATSLAAIKTLPPKRLPSSGWHPVGKHHATAPDETVVKTDHTPPIRTQTAHPQSIEPARARVVPQRYLR